MTDIGVDIDGNFLRNGADIKVISASESVRQRLRIALLMFLGEWFENKYEGVDWFGVILTRPFKTILADREIRLTAMSVIGVKSVTGIKFEQKDGRVLGIVLNYKDIYQEEELSMEVNAP